MCCCPLRLSLFLSLSFFLCLFFVSFFWVFGSQSCCLITTHLVLLLGVILSQVQGFVEPWFCLRFLWACTFSLLLSIWMITLISGVLTAPPVCCHPQTWQSIFVFWQWGIIVFKHSWWSLPSRQSYGFHTKIVSSFCCWTAKAYSCIILCLDSY